MGSIIMICCIILCVYQFKIYKGLKSLQESVTTVPAVKKKKKVVHVSEPEAIELDEDYE